MKISNYDKIYKAIQSISISHVVAIHDESSFYVFKTFNGKWNKVNFLFINELAGLPKENCSFL